MSTNSQESNNAGASTSNTDATTTQLANTSTSGSGEGQPSTPKIADPPAAEAKQDTGIQTAQETAELAKKAIDSNETLRKLAGKKDDKKADDQSTAKADDKSVKDTDKKTEPKTDDKSAVKSDDRSAAYEPQEPRAKAKFAEMRTQLKAKDEEIAQLRSNPSIPDTVREAAEFGENLSKVFDSVRDDFDVVTDEQLADIVSVRGSINRVSNSLENGERPYQADVRKIEDVYRTITDLATQLGIAQDAPALPEPFSGTLPDKWQKLVEYGDLSEEEARFHAAAEAARAGGRTPAKTRTPAAPAREEKREPKSLPSRSRQEPSSRQEIAPDEKLYKSRTRQFILDGKFADSPQAANDYWKNKLAPIIIRELVAPHAGDENPVDYFLKLSPRDRFDLARDAQEIINKRTAESKPPEVKKKTDGEAPKTSLFQRSFTTRRGLDQPTNTDERKALAKEKLDFLAGKSGE